VQAFIFKKIIDEIGSKFNNEVIVFNGGLEALQYIKNNKRNLSLVVLDLMLPDCSGFDIITRINKFNSKLPIIVLSANDDKNLLVKAIKLGAYDYFVKASSEKELENFYNAIVAVIRD
jgi:DNA-binding response OmpR family regulator